MNYRFVDISDAVSVPVPRDSTPEEEAEAIAQYRAMLGPKELAGMEAEYRDLLEQAKQGNSVSLEELLQDLGVLDRREKKESA